MKVLVCGGRDYADQQKVDQVLGAIDRIDGIDTIIEGCASGADSLAEDWARRMGKVLRHFPADWQKHGRAAGPLRNRQMLLEGRPDAVVAFPGGRGTAHMTRIAQEAGVPVRIVT